MCQRASLQDTSSVSFRLGFKCFETRSKSYGTQGKLFGTQRKSYGIQRKTYRTRRQSYLQDSKTVLPTGLEGSLAGLKESLLRLKGTHFLAGKKYARLKALKGETSFKAAVGTFSKFVSVFVELEPASKCQFKFVRIAKTEIAYQEYWQMA